MGFVFVLCLFLLLFLFYILTKLCPSSRSTVAQQFFWSPFIVFFVSVVFVIFRIVSDVF